MIRGEEKLPVRIITVEREYGSGGAMIARRLAERLGWKIWDEELTAEIARVANVDTGAAARKFIKPISSSMSIPGMEDCRLRSTRPPTP